MMRVMFAALCLSACAGGPSPSASTGTTPAQLGAAQAIAQLQGEWRRALATGDTAFFARTLVDNFLLTGGRTTLSKDEFLRAVAADSGRVPSSRPEATNVRLFGNLAVVTGLVLYEAPGQSIPLVSRYTEVWVEERGKWRAVHGHYNPVPPSAASGR